MDWRLVGTLVVKNRMRRVSGSRLDTARVARKKISQVPLLTDDDIRQSYLDRASRLLGKDEQV